jgi:hypothetical protein
MDQPSTRPKSHPPSHDHDQSCGDDTTPERSRAAASRTHPHRDRCSLGSKTPTNAHPGTPSTMSRYRTPTSGAFAPLSQAPSPRRDGRSPHEPPHPVTNVSQMGSSTSRHPGLPQDSTSLVATSHPQPAQCPAADGSNDPRRHRNDHKSPTSPSPLAQGMVHLLDPPQHRHASSSRAQSETPSNDPCPTRNPCGHHG